MPFKIVRNDITKMKADAVVNTANEYPEVGPGCDRAVYEEKLLLRRGLIFRQNISSTQ